LLSVLGDAADNSKVNNHGQRILSRKTAYTADVNINPRERRKINLMYTILAIIQGLRAVFLTSFFQDPLFAGAKPPYVQKLKYQSKAKQRTKQNSNLYRISNSIPEPQPAFIHQQKTI